MTAAVAIVTDSTAYLPDDFVAARGITVVPLQVAVDGDVSEEGRGRPHSALREWRAITPSRPAPERFGRPHRAAGEGAHDVARARPAGGAGRRPRGGPGGRCGGAACGGVVAGRRTG